MYLYKYVYKGHNCANCKVTESDQVNHDGVRYVLDVRYVSMCETFWKLSEFKIHHNSYSISSGWTYISLIISQFSALLETMKRQQRPL